MSYVATVSGEKFYTIDDVTAPEFHVGQKVKTSSSGRQVDAVITRVAWWEVRGHGSKKFWAWSYGVSINGVSVTRGGDEITATASN